MTYQELIKIYPWIDMALELFKGIMPTVVALFTIFMTELFIRKRNKISKRKEMELQYLQKMLTWIHEIRQDIFDISVALNMALSREIPERMFKFNEVKNKMTEMNKSAFILCDTYKEISACMGYDFCFDRFKSAIIYFSEVIEKIGCKYLNHINTEKSVEEVNSIIEQTRENINASSSLLVSKISLLYGKKKGHKYIELIGYIGEKQMFKGKKKLFAPYGFDEKNEYKIYRQIGEEYRKAILGKKIKKQINNVHSFDTYLEWKEYFINKFSKSCSWNCNFYHYLNEKYRICQRKLELYVSVAVPIYVGEISCLITIYQSDEIELTICQQLFMLLVAIILTIVISFISIRRCSCKMHFLADCKSIIDKMGPSHQN